MELSEFNELLVLHQFALTALSLSLFSPLGDSYRGDSYNPDSYRGDSYRSSPRMGDKYGGGHDQYGGGGRDQYGGGRGEYSISRARRMDDYDADSAGDGGLDSFVDGRR